MSGGIQHAKFLGRINQMLVGGASEIGGEASPLSHPPPLLDETLMDNYYGSRAS